MSRNDSAILSDPIFQLNFVLWMLHRSPVGAPIRPILREAGYVLDAISRPLPPPIALRPRIAALVGSSTAASPDVLAEGPKQTPWLIVECKGKSFGVGSSTARQALKLLATAPDLTESLGLSSGSVRPAHVAYLSQSEECHLFVETLAEVRAQLAAAGMAAGTAGTLGVARRQGGMYVERSDTEGWPAALAGALQEAVRVIELKPDEDPRPLYLIPWDPGVDQDPEMRNYCRSVLFARVLTEATAVVGRADVPQRISLAVDHLLSQATYGISERWRSRGDLAKVVGECKRFLGGALAPVRERLSVALPSSPDRVELTLHSQSDQDTAIDALEKANPEDQKSLEPDNQIPLPLPERT